MNALELIKEKLTKDDVKRLLESLGFTSLNISNEQIRSKCKVHDGNNPSAFSYSLSKHMWHCHSCGAGGDVVQLLEDMRKMSFKEATDFMLAFVGITDISNIDYVQRHNRYLQELEAFKSYVLRNKKENKLYALPSVVAKDVLQFRGFTESTLKHFELKFIPEMPFQKLDGTVSTITNRLGMPILFDNKIVGYAFRKTKATDNPKWLFQPTGLDKKNLIYNLEKRWYENIIICEGQFDVWAFYQAGLNNVGCVLGSSITQEQEEILTKCTDTLLLAFDGDEAGIKATVRAIDQLKYKFNLYVIRFPDGKDACDLDSEALIECYQNKIHYSKWRK